MVAKSYQDYKIISEPFIQNGRRYVKVLNPKTNKEKVVRFYTQSEYNRYYPPVKVIKPGNYKHILGFDNGYITLFKGNTYENLEWFERSNARFHTTFKWYVVSTEEVPADVPEGITPVLLSWELVGNDDGTLKDNVIINKVVENLIYDEGNSRYQGEVGDKIERDVKVIKNIEAENYYGINHIMTFIDANGNLYCWSTAAKNWEIGKELTIKGTIKSLGTYQRQKITYLTRCSEVG